MPHDIDVGSATKKGCENPYATEGSITIKPHKHRRREDKIHQTVIDIVLLIEKNRCKTYQDALSESNILVRIITLLVLRNEKFETPTGEKISAGQFMKLAKKYAKDKVDAEYRFWIEDMLRDTADEMIEEWKKADAELAAQKEKKKQNE